MHQKKETRFLGVNFLTKPDIFLQKPGFCVSPNQKKETWFLGVNFLTKPDISRTETWFLRQS